MRQRRLLSAVVELHLAAQYGRRAQRHGYFDYALCMILSVSIRMIVASLSDILVHLLQSLRGLLQVLSSALADDYWLGCFGSLFLLVLVWNGEQFEFVYLF